MAEPVATHTLMGVTDTQSFTLYIYLCSYFLSFYHSVILEFIWDLRFGYNKITTQILLGKFAKALFLHVSTSSVGLECTFGLRVSMGGR